jgi:myo-inositol 2-dehydrogenase/D-chiro-inositol 1-dehydrogenase
MGAVHLEAIQSSRLVELAGVVEPVAETRVWLRERGIEVYETVAGMLSGERPDGVLISAPSDQHPALVETFAAAAIPILCEKPLGVHLGDTVAAATAARDAGVLLQVGYWRRFVPQLRALRDRIAAGELGQISQLSCMQWDADLPPESFRSRSGGIAVDLGVHEFDQARWLLGQEFEWLSGTAAGPNSRPRPAADPDSATLLGGMSGGAAVVVSLGRRFPHADSCWVEIWGTMGYERVPYMWDRDGELVFVDSMRRQAEAFARAIRGGTCEGAQPADAIAAQTVAAQAARALERSGARSRE